MLPEPSSAKRGTLIAWTIAAVIGTVGVWWLSSYMDDLTTLAETDRNAALTLFRSRALPALVLVVGVAVAAGVFLARQGLQIVRRAREDPDLVVEGTRGNAPARAIGLTMAVAGFLMAVVPLVLLSIVLWLLRGA